MKPMQRVVYALHPALRAQYAIATFERNVFLTRDMGEN